MESISTDEHVQFVDDLFKQACNILNIKDVSWRVMSNRVAPVNTAKNYSLGYTDLKKRVITIDIFTPRRRQAKSANGILRVLAHEIAHLQKPPFRQLFKRRVITRIHYPEFYQQVNDNITIFKNDPRLGNYFKQVIAPKKRKRSYFSLLPPWNF